MSQTNDTPFGLRTQFPGLSGDFGMGGPTFADTIRGFGNVGGSVLSGSSLAGDIITDPGMVDQLTALSMTPKISPSGGGNGWGSATFTDKANMVLSGLGLISNLWMGSKQLNLAKRNQKLAEQTTQANYDAQRQDTMRGLQDIGRTRAFTEGRSEADGKAWADSYTPKDLKFGRG